MTGSPVLFAMRFASVVFPLPESPVINIRIAVLLHIPFLEGWTISITLWLCTCPVVRILRCLPVLISYRRIIMCHESCPDSFLKLSSFLVLRRQTFSDAAIIICNGKFCILSGLNFYRLIVIIHQITAPVVVIRRFFYVAAHVLKQQHTAFPLRNSQQPL